MESETQELLPEEAVALLKGRRKLSEPEELSPQDATAYLKGIRREKPSGLGQAFASSALETASAVPGLLNIASEKVGELTGTKPGGLFGVVEEKMVGAGEAIDPVAGRGQGGLPEDLARGAGSIAGSVPAMMAGPAAATVQFGAQMGVPIYYDIKASTGDEEAAMWGLLFGGLTGQLEKFGAERALGSIVKKLSGKGVAQAVTSLALRTALTSGQEGGTEALQTAAEGAILEALTPEDVAIWENVKRALPPALILGGAFGAVDGAIQRGKQAQPAPGPSSSADPSGYPAETAGNAPATAPAEAALPPTDVAPAAPAPTGKTVAQVSEEARARGAAQDAPGARQAEVAPPATPGPAPSQAQREGVYKHTKEPASNSSVQPGDHLGPVEPIEIGLLREWNPGKRPEERKVQEIMAAMERGEALPPVIVSLSGEPGAQQTIIDDGSHRIEAARRLGYTKVPTRRVSAPPKAPEIETRREADVVASIRSLVDLWDPQSGKAPADALDAVDQATRVARNREAAGVATTDADKMLLELVEMSREKPADIGSAEEAAQTDKTLAAVTKAKGLLGSFKEGRAEGERRGAAPKAPATKVEQEPTPTTGIKNATVERELEQMGLPPPEPSEKVTDVARHAKAKTVFEKDPQAGARLVDDLEAKPRPPTGDEDALLTFEVNRLITEREAAQDAFNAEPSEANQTRIDKAQEAYKRTSDVLKRSGSESSASLRLRKMMIARDYSLAEMERSFQAEKGGKPLTAKESKLVQDLHKKIAATQKAHEEFVSAAKLREQELEARALLAEAKKEVAKERPSFQKRKAAVAASKKRIDEIINKLAGGQKAAAGLDLEKVKLTFDLAVESLKLGYRSFNVWADEMVQRIGEHIRPYLRQAWDTASAARDQEMVERYKKRKKTDIATLKEKTAKGDFASSRRKTPVELDPEAVKLKADYESAKREFATAKEKARLAARTKKEKAVDVAKEFVRFPRAVLSAFDVSAPGRQGIFFALGHPIQTTKQIKRMFQALKSERVAAEIDAEIQSHPLYSFADASGLDLVPMEETMVSRFAEKIPLKIGAGVRASNRAFSTFINLQRFHTFARMVGALPGTPTLDQGRAIARAVNIGTGRGDPGRFAGAMEGAAHVLWSPRLLVSRFQTLIPTHLRKADPAVRKLVAKEYARFLAGAAGAYALVQLADMLDDEDDVSVEWDPRSSDFGKFRMGNVRIDPLGGLSQVTTFLSRVVSGEKKTGSGNVQPIRGEVKFGQDDTLDVAVRFLRSKFSPVMAAITDVAVGENVIGEKTTPTSVVKNLVVPISMRDVFEDMQDLGVPKTAALTVLSMFGLGVQNYESGSTKTAKKD